MGTDYHVLLPLLLLMSPAAADDLCNRVYDVSNRTIIKATESVNKGGKFLVFKPASGYLQCQQMCCDTPDCNIAVLENRVCCV